MARGLFDLEIPFFLPKWRRVLAVALPVGWGGFEVSTGEFFWGILFIGMGGIAGWRFVTADWDAVAKQADDA